MPSKKIAASPASVANAGLLYPLHRRRTGNVIRKALASLLLTVVVTACAQNHDAKTQLTFDMPSSSSSHANKLLMENTQNNTTPAAPRMTAEEISHRMLDLIGNLKTADDISFKNLEAAFGLKVYRDEKNANEYGTGAKITDTWFFNLTVILGVKEAERSRLLFSFDDQTHSSASMTEICQVDFDAYLKRLTELGFQAEPYHGEHNRLIYWYFTRGNVTLHIYIRGENGEKPTHHCVSMINIQI